MTTMRLAIVLPVFNEAAVLPGTLTELVGALRGVPELVRVDLVIVDDGSTDDVAQAAETCWAGLRERGPVEALHLVRLEANQGHQRAILAGLRYLGGFPWEACLILDADGQDDPAAVRAMLAVLDQGHDAVFARRSKRGEGLAWRLAYQVYQLVFRLLLGQTLPLGNFCVLRRPVVQRLCGEGDLAHLAATVSTYALRRATVPVPRRPRSGGETKMSLWRLVDYGVAAMTASVPAWTRLFTRLAFVTAGLSVVGTLSVVAIRVGTSLAISGWASTICLLTFGISLQATGFVAMTAFLRRILGHLAPLQVSSSVKVLDADARRHVGREAS